MNKLLIACAVSCAALTGVANSSYADMNDKMKDSKYCRDMSFDVICMGPEMMAMRQKMMEMNKDMAMAARTKYCQDSSNGSDPICDPKMMNDATGY